MFMEFLTALSLSEAVDGVSVEMCARSPWKPPSKALFENDSFGKSEDTRFTKRYISSLKKSFIDKLENCALKRA